MNPQVRASTPIEHATVLSAKEIISISSSAGKRIAVLNRFAIEWLEWIVETRIQRQVAPGKRPLEKHEFESVEIRRGGFGNVF